MTKEIAEMKTQGIVRGTLSHLKQSKARVSTESVPTSGSTLPAELATGGSNVRGYGEMLRSLSSGMSFSMYYD